MIDLKILSTPDCAPCKAVEKSARGLMGEFEHLRVEKVDLMERPELAAQYGVMTVPIVVINGEVAFVGAVSEAGLRAKLYELDPERKS